MNKAFILNGVAESGKDEVYKIFKKYFKNDYTRFIFNISTIDSIRKFLADYGLIEKTNEWREGMSSIKNSIEKIDKNAINDLIIKTIEDKIFYVLTKDKFIFIHCREPHNIEYLKKELSKFVETKTILVIRPNVIGKFQCDKDDFEIISRYDYDYTFLNNDLEIFEKDIVQFIESMYNEN